MSGLRLSDYQALILKAMSKPGGRLVYAASVEQYQIADYCVRRSTVRSLMASGFVCWAGTKGRDLIDAVITAKGRKALEAYHTGSQQVAA